MSKTVLALAAAQVATAHYGLIYPEWRADTLDTPEDSEYNQWVYPCTSQTLQYTLRSIPEEID
jgi:hypothetical protein